MGTALQSMDLAKYSKAISRLDTVRQNGRVSQVVGVLVESLGPACGVGEICEVHGRRDAAPILAEVVGFRGPRTLLMPFARVDSIAPGSDVVATGSSLKVPVGGRLLGRVLDGLGRPLDAKGSLGFESEITAAAGPPHPLTRQRITQPLSLGVKAIDALLTIGKGQRIGVFSGSGVGKSTLLGMMARNTSADVNVIALVGERGREVRDFLEKDLGE